MSAFALSIVLAAAVMHASWNAVVKGAGDRALTLSAVALMNVVVGSILIAVSPPPSLDAWPFLAASTVFHYLYYVLLFNAYRLGDLSQVYPISRGMAPALVAFGSYLMIGETLSAIGIGGLVLITLGIGLIALQRGAANSSRESIVYATLLGLVIAAYSVADGVGVRWSGSAMGYTGWLFVLEAPVVLAVLLPRVARRRRFDISAFGIGMIGGLLSAAAYATVLYAKTIAPIGAVSAVRESSVIIAALIGVFFFQERPWGSRLAAALIVVAGVILLAEG